MMLYKAVKAPLLLTYLSLNMDELCFKIN
jgi:hypothetical protein